MRPLNKSTRAFPPQKLVYKPYGSSKNELIQAIGHYCSYCEIYVPFASLEVEHVRDKNTHTKRTYLWRNFVLACKNCNTIKSQKPVTSMYFPTVHNTFEIFTYNSSGQVKLNTTLLSDINEQTKATNLIKLVGLDRVPGHRDLSDKDKRWEERMRTWELAERYLKKFIANKADEETIIDLAKIRGGWSIWMSVFENHPSIKTELINQFNGTQTKYFP
ncbi:MULTISPECIES: HNH endonuclease [Vibrio]|uniref:HNH endonuclease n=1 Tax=Vibrio TaxID=662 RepID=UPI0002EA5A83|nr:MULTISPECIES: HNH endonuclease [Vibrio]OEF86136.1 hypothetical protein A162_09510 [Vibrio tasmaniensis 1F-155]PTO77579.1 HNH endonuclease [Vibrio splendidus]